MNGFGQHGSVVIIITSLAYSISKRRLRYCSRSFLPSRGKIPPTTQATKQSDQEAKLFLSEMNCNKHDSALSSFTAHN